MKRSPSAALWLSLLPGAGHVYVGQPAKGAILILLLGSVIQMMGHGAGGFGIVIPFIWLYAMLDAYRAASEHNHALDTGTLPPKAPGFALSKWWGAILIGLGVIFTLHNADIIDLEFIWDYWPLGLVATGVYILTRQPASSPTGAPSPTASAPLPPPNLPDADEPEPGDAPENV